MKKVKITVLKTTLDEQLAREYGAEGLTACPMLKDKFFMLIMPSRKVFVTKLGKRFTNMLLRCHMVPEKKYSIMETGSENRELPSAVAMTDYALSYSSSKRRTKSPR